VDNLWGPEKISDPCGKRACKGAINEGFTVFILAIDFH